MAVLPSYVTSHRPLSRVAHYSLNTLGVDRSTSTGQHHSHFMPNMATQPPPAVQISVIQEEEDIVKGFSCAAKTFGHQIHDGIWMAANPGWDTRDGEASGAARLVKRFQNTTKDNEGNPNTIFIKATVPSTGKLVGFAIWEQASVVPGYGEKPIEDMSTGQDLEQLYPGNRDEQLYFADLVRSLHSQRIAVVKSRAADAIPAVFALDLCCVDPDFQGQGIAKKLVVWGLEESKRRGGLEAVLEASAMGRHVYSKLGFVQEGPEIAYQVDEKFKDRVLPSNIFMRTKPLDG